MILPAALSKEMTPSTDQVQPLSGFENDDEVVFIQEPAPELDLDHATVEVRDSVLLIRIPKRLPLEQTEEETLHFG
jgi:hypothetical protein